tara:strand:+ start:800 stop:3382 length:2583 start_codon:yes stop_codon:yes gene_type:complete
MTSFTLNGQLVTVADKHPHLLSALRDELNVLSPKDGCAPSGQCGCCTVLIDGKARVACQMSMERIESTSIITLEGIDEKEREQYSSAFAARGALQCGFCIPGIVVRAKALIDKKDGEVSRNDLERHLGAHLCRCTGYTKILEAIESVAANETPEEVPVGGIGSCNRKYEAEELALGDRPYIDDLRPEGLLHGAVHLASYARADVLKIDTTKAEEIKGVHQVFTASDVPGQLRVGIIHSDWPIFIPEGGRTSYLGDVLAFVVADDRETARYAASLVEVEYKPLQVFNDPVIAVSAEEDAVWELEGNVLSVSTYDRGDIEQALALSEHVVEEVFQTQRIEHAFLEPESTLVTPNGDIGLYVWSGGQGIWDDRNQIASVLNIDANEVTVELVSNGGAFGGKEDMSNQAQTALAAWILKKPVRCTLSREESFLIHAKRHPIRMSYKAGCDAEGRLQGLWVRMIGDSGPYASVGMKVLERAAGHASGPYVVPNINVEATAVRTNNPVCGAFRGFGANQAQFAMEGVMDRLAEKVGITGWEIRNRNVVTPGSVWGPGQIMDDGCLGARACLEEVKESYEEAVSAGKPVGIGLGLKNSGLGNGFKEIAQAVIHFRDDEQVEVRHCWTEMGQGIHTVAQQVAVEELKIDPSRIEVIVDTTREMGAGQTTGSRGTLMGAGAVADACRIALEDGCKKGVDYLGEYRVDWTNSLNDGVENPIIHSTFGYAAQVVVLDPDTGEVDEVIAAHDVGRAVNPILCEGQIEGSVHMGLGYALTEGFPVDENSYPVNNTLRKLGIIRPSGMPKVDVRLVESPQPNSPYGIKGVGEIGLVPTAGAVAAAMKNHDGGWRNTLPLVDDSQQEQWANWDGS